MSNATPQKHTDSIVEVPSYERKASQLISSVSVQTTFSLSHTQTHTQM